MTNGFETPEAQENAIKENNEKVKNLTVKICASEYFVNWAYYCTKHQLTDDQINVYVIQEMNKMKSFRNNTWVFEYCLKTYPENVKEILREYESYQV